VRRVWGHRDIHPHGTDAPDIANPSATPGTEDGVDLFGGCSTSTAVLVLGMLALGAAIFRKRR
ncbi:MAG: hypothetical protein LBQ56_03075, partial [Synergistaceae bacterium]|nr:hypothetical protein [Synergistaceae bacterium]